MASDLSGKSHSEPEYAKKQDRAKVPYYIVDLDPRISPEVSAAFPIVCTKDGSVC